jgi:lysophospholipase L1-like esterase
MKSILTLITTLILLNSIHAKPFCLLTIGDSLSAEYAYQTRYSAPDSEPGKANAKNWAEILTEHRSDLFSMGNFNEFYDDLRYAGYELNFSVPGSKARDWDKVLNGPFSEDDPSDPLFYLKKQTQTELSKNLPKADAILIFLGANDLNLIHTDKQNEMIRQNIINIHTYIRAKVPTNTPIIIATVPDTGMTPRKKISDPTKATTARRRVATLNSDIITLNQLPYTYIARIDTVIQRALESPLLLCGKALQYLPDRQNSALHIFCKDGFHANTVSQAMIANEILKVINSFAPNPIPPFSDQEVFCKILQQKLD